MDRVGTPDSHWRVREQFPPETTSEQVQAVEAFIAGVARLLVARWETEGHTTHE